MREIALLLAAEVVDRQLEDYLLAHGIEQLWGTQERILVCLTRGSNTQAMIASGRRNADRFHGELFAVYVRDDRLSEKDEAVLQGAARGSASTWERKPRPSRGTTRLKP